MGHHQAQVGHRPTEEQRSPLDCPRHGQAMKAKAPNTPTRLPVPRQRIAPRLLLQDRMESRVETGHVVDIWQETSGGPDGFDQKDMMDVYPPEAVKVLDGNPTLANFLLMKGRLPSDPSAPKRTSVL